jgi:hypothetical protein
MLGFALAVLAAATAGCGGGGGGGGPGATPTPLPTATPTAGDDPSPLAFDDLMQKINTDKYPATASDFSSFIGAEQDLLNTVKTSSSESEIKASADNLIDALETFEGKLNVLDAFLTEYQNRVLGTGKGFKTGTADPIAAIQTGQLIQACKDKVAACEALPDEIDRLECLKQLNTSCGADAINFGASALFGAGATAVTGLAIAAAPITISVVAATGVSVAVGTVAGIVFSYCTSTSPKATGPVCALNTADAPIGQNGGLSTSVYQGTGTLIVNIPGCAPIVVDNVVVGANGADVTVTCVSDETSDETKVAQATDDSSQTGFEAQDDGSGNCGSISSISVSTDPADPGPGQNVTVFARIFPSAVACSVSYSVSGTDGYADSGTVSTDANGSINFFIPGGAEGVVDTVTVESGGRQTVITYTF